MINRHTRFRALLFIIMLGSIFSAIASGETTPTANPGSIITNISYEKADLLQTLEEIALKAGYNLIATPEVQGEVTIHLAGVTYDEALKIITRSRGFVYEQEGKYFYVGKPGQSMTSQEHIAFFPIAYADPKLLAELLTKTLGTGGGQVINDDRTRTIIVKGSQTLIGQAEQIIKTLDRKLPQITVEVKVIAVSTTAVQKMGMELELDKSSLSWNQTSSGVQIILGMIRNGKSWNVIFKNLMSEGKAQLITSPSVSTMNGQEASITIADKIPIEHSDEDGNISTEFVDVGIKLVFTPIVQQNDELYIDLTTSVSSLGDKMGSSYRIINKEVKSRIQAKINETVFLGGLISREEQKTLSKVPKLAEFPVIGRIFRNSELSNNENELIITFSPSWNNTSDPAKTTSRQY